MMKLHCSNIDQLLHVCTSMFLFSKTFFSSDSASRPLVSIAATAATTMNFVSDQKINP